MKKMLKKLLLVLMLSWTPWAFSANTNSFSGSIITLPPGVTPDPSANFGLFALMNNLNQDLDWGNLVAVAGGSSTSITLTAAQTICSQTDYSGSPGGGVTMTTPTHALLAAAMPNGMPQIIQYTWRLINDGSGQTVTLTAGTGVTITGTATVATNAWRDFGVNINRITGATNIVNLGGGNL